MRHWSKWWCSMVEVEYSVARELLLLIYNKELVEVEQEFRFI